MSKASTGFAFVAGLTIGAAGAWYYLKDKYAKLAEEEIASVKAAYAKREKPTTEEKRKLQVQVGHLHSRN